MSCTGIKLLAAKLEALVLNDTRRDEGHLGCITVMENLEALCWKNNIEIIATIPDRHPLLTAKLNAMISQCDLVIVNGEGSMHSDRKIVDEILTIAEYTKQNGKPVYLVNSIWLDNSQHNERLSCFNEVYLRDQKSKKIAAGYTKAAKYVSDLSLYSSKKYSGNSHQASNRVQPPVFTDSVLRGVTNQLFKMATNRGAPFYFMGNAPRKKAFRKYPFKTLFRGTRNLETGVLDEQVIWEAPTIVTGRFHATLFAVMIKTPFVAIGSNTSKIQQFFEDAGITDAPFIESNQLDEVRLSEKLDEAKKFWTEERRVSADTFLKSARQSIDEMFQSISKNSDNHETGNRS